MGKRWYCNLVAATRRRSHVMMAFALSLLIGLGGISSFASTKGLSSDGPVIHTASGAVRGVTRDGINMFLGIPYASPPVGDLRWRPPQPAKPWSGVRAATHFASTCAQATQFGVFAGPVSTSEDCLYLNVFVAKGAPKNAKRPVIVWLHGGANLSGESDDYDASKLATGGPDGVETVVVTINYRLGVLGLFSNPAINSEGHPWGNYTILDQQAALRWVQQNIAAFGGDPTKVAIAGQSAGAVNIGVHMLSPLSKGLFSRAISQSSPGFTAWYLPRTIQDQLSANFTKQAGCPESGEESAKCLRNLSVARILQIEGTPKSFNMVVSPSPFVDGTILPSSPEQAWQAGNFNKVPLLGGSTKDEYMFFTGAAEYFTGPPQSSLTAKEYAAKTAGGQPCDFCNFEFSFRSDAAAQYPLSSYGDDPMMAMDRIESDPIKCRELHVLNMISKRVPTYAYDFSYRNAPYYYPKMSGYRPLAAHTIDIQFLFPKWHGGPLGVNLDQETGQPRELNAQETKLSDEMVAEWTNFADTGNPNGKGDAPWPRFTGGDDAKYFVQDIPTSLESVAEFRKQYQCDFWDPRIKY
ncbi:para-nitrobenzyl esterase [Trinickia symbiotica]|nr:para-nitrobenzyl esterase [Trinickia symbiotica]